MASSTEMIKHKPVRNIAHKLLISKPMSERTFPGESRPVELPVPLLGETGCPQPALTKVRSVYWNTSILVDLIPEKTGAPSAGR